MSTIAPRKTRDRKKDNRSSSFGGRVWLARERMGLSRSQLAARAGVPMRTLEKVEYGQIPCPGLDTVRALRQALDVGYAELIDGRPEMG